MKPMLNAGFVARRVDFAYSFVASINLNSAIVSKLTLGKEIDFRIEKCASWEIRYSAPAAT